MMSSGKPLFLQSERSFTLFEGDEMPPRCMSFRLRMEALVRCHYAQVSFGHLSYCQTMLEDMCTMPV